MKMGNKEYNFGIKENKELGYKGIILKDKTQLVITKTGLSLMFPKKKFLKIFQKQIQDKSRTHIGIMFNKLELKAIIKGLFELYKFG